MSTYLSGNPTFLPTVQPYQPNFQLYAGALQMKQTQYDKNRKQISELYGSLLNSPMTRDSNIKARDEFFNTIDYEIKKLASVDLSLQENADAASGLFTSLYDNKNIVKDMVWTKNFFNQLERAEGFKNCIDPDKCGGAYWDGGVQALEYQRQEFKNLSDEDAMGYGDVSYTPYVNLHAKATKLFKDYGWDVKVDSISPDGKWIVTTKNGEQITGPLLAHFQGLLGEDPAVMSYYKTKKYVDRKGWIASNIPTYGSEQAAEEAYLNEQTAYVNRRLAQLTDESDFAKDQANRKAQEAQKNIQQGVIKNDEEVSAVVNSLFGEKDMFESASKTTGTALTNTSSTSVNMKLRAQALDNALAMLEINDDLSKSAQILAYQQYEQSIKINPEQEHRWRMEEIAYKDRLEKESAEEELRGDSYLNQMFPGDKVKSDINVDPTAAYDMQRADAREQYKALRTNSQVVLSKTFESAVEHAKSGGAQGEQDAVAIMDAVIKQYKHTQDYGGSPEKRKHAAAVLKRWESKSTREKVGWAKNANIEQFLSGIDPEGIHRVNNKSVIPMYAKNGYNKTNRVYLENTKANIGGAVMAAEDAADEYAQWKKVKAETHKTVVSYLKTNGPEEYAKYWDYLVDESGNARDINAFAFKYANDKASSAQGKSASETIAQFIKAEPERYRAIKEQAMLRWSDQNVMSDARRAQFGNNKQRYINSAVLDAAKQGRTSVKITQNGQTKYIPVDEFFTKDGHVKSKYSAYANKWKPADKSGFWQAYDEAVEAYAGADTADVMPGLGTKLTNAAIAGLTGGYSQATYNKLMSADIKEATKGLEKTIKTRNTDIMRLYKEAFNNAPIYKGGKTYMDLYGSGSLTGYGLKHYVDYAAPQSESVLRERSFMMDAFNAMPGKEVFFGFGDMSSIPQKSDANAQAFVKQLILDAVTSSKKSDSRPRWSATYNPIGAGNEKYQSYTITINDPAWLKAYVGSKESKGPYYDYFAGNQGGQYGKVTILLKDDAASENNILHMTTKRTSLEKRLGYRGEAPVAYGKYDNIHNLRIKTLPNGGYSVVGPIAVGYDEATGKWESDVINQQYGPGTDPNMINQQFDGILSDVSTRLGIFNYSVPNLLGQ